MHGVKVEYASTDITARVGYKSSCQVRLEKKLDKVLCDPNNFNNEKCQINKINPKISIKELLSTTKQKL